MDAKLRLNTAIGTEVMLPLAGAGSRAYAYIIDWHFRVGLVLLWLTVWLSFSWPVDFSTLADDDNNLLWLIIPSSVLYLLYHPILELLMQGDTPGKRWIGLNCVDAQGNAPSNGAILLRNVMRIVDSLPVLYTVGITSIIFSKNQQRLGDMVADTRVVVAMEDSQKALAKLDRIEHATVGPQEAELVIEILDRWKTLTKTKRRELAESLLGRLSITVETNDRALKRQLEVLLG